MVTVIVALGTLQIGCQEGSDRSEADKDSQSPQTLTRGPETRTSQKPTGRINGVAFSPDGTQAASVGGEYGKPGQVKVWDATSGTESLTLKGHTDGVSSVAFIPDGTRLASASNAKTVKVWDVTARQKERGKK